jgi:Leucine-rich repeat (LRR) protein
MAQNKLTKLPQVSANSLRKLNLEENQIEECDLKTHPNLTHLNLNKNKLKSLAGITAMKNLEVLTVNE